MTTVELRHLTPTEQIWLRDKWVGKKFNRLTIVEVVGKCKKSHHPFGRVECECGNVKIVNLPGVQVGNTKSCGCLKIEQSRKNTRSFCSYNELRKAFLALENKYDSLKKENDALKKYKDEAYGLRAENFALRDEIRHLLRHVSTSPDKD